MKIKELIAKLQEFDGELEILSHTEHTYGFYYVRPKRFKEVKNIRTIKFNGSSKPSLKHILHSGKSIEKGLVI